MTDEISPQAIDREEQLKTGINPASNVAAYMGPGSANGTNPRVKNNVKIKMPEPVRWPVVVGQAPHLAASFQQRNEIAKELWDNWGKDTDAPNQAVATVQLLSGDGGVGKTQLARSLFDAAGKAGVQLRIWVQADSFDGLLGGLLSAGQAVRAPGAQALEVELAARSFLSWLASTKSTWFIVLDDLNIDPAMVATWWPQGHGRVLVTTRFRDTRLDSFGSRRMNVGAFEAHEGVAYLTARFAAHSDPMPHDALVNAERLVVELGGLPLALAQAAGTILNDGGTADSYRTAFLDQTRTLADVANDWDNADNYRRTVRATWEIAIARGDEISPRGLARPAAALCSLVAPAGVTLELFTSPPALHYLGLFIDRKLTSEDARLAIRALHRLSIVDHDPNGGPTAIRIHALAQRAIRDSIGDSAVNEVATILADSVLLAWQQEKIPSSLAVALRATVQNLLTIAPMALFSQVAHPALSAMAVSLRHAGLLQELEDLLESLIGIADGQLGPKHIDTLGFRHDLCWNMAQRGRVQEALRGLKEVYGIQKQELGGGARSTLKSRHSELYWKGYLGDSSGLLQALEKLKEQQTLLFGFCDQDTMATRHTLAQSRSKYGSLSQAIAEFQVLEKDRNRSLGDFDSATISTRHVLAVALNKNNQSDLALPIMESVVEQWSSLGGRDSPSALGARAALATMRAQQGCVDEAIEELKEIALVQAQVLGSEHPATYKTRLTLARWVGEKHPKEALSSLGQLRDDQLKHLGRDNPDVLATRFKYAEMLGKTGQGPAQEAELQVLLDDQRRLLGLKDHRTQKTMRILDGKRRRKN